jgi:type I restriction enzyme, S subunit
MSSRNGWMRVKFGDVVRNVSDTVSDPAGVGLNRAVGLEHLDPGELAITRWASTGDGLTFSRRFRAGHVLYGRRRVYQRKAGVPDFEGVCSGDIYVLEPINETAMLPELLPFIVHGQPFHEYALRTSAGSLSPRTKWGDLKEYELDLPPVDEQRELAGLLWGIEKLRRRLLALRDSMNRALNVSLNASVASTALTTLASYLDRIEAGRSPAAAGRPAGEYEFGVLKVSAVGDGIFEPAENKALLSSEDFDRAREVRAGDLLVSRANASVSGVARPCVVGRVRDGLMLSDKTLRLVPKEGVTPEFLLLAMRSSAFRNHVRLSANETEAKNISQAKLLRGPVPQLDGSAQDRIVSGLADGESAIRAIERRLLTVRRISESLRREARL